MEVKEKYNIAILGAGQIGTAMRDLIKLHGLTLPLDPDIKVRLLDKYPRSDKNGQVDALDVGNRGDLKTVISNSDIIINALPHTVSKMVAEQTIAAGDKLYLDFTEDVENGSDVVLAASKAANGSIVMPHCGLAPGAVSIIAQGLIDEFTEVSNVYIRVGALPQSCNNSLQYYRSWSVDGLVNEYIKDCQIISNGIPKTVAGLSGLEEVTIDGQKLEAFYTSGGIGTLIKSLGTKLSMDAEVDYKTLRYRGHCEKMKFLLHDLRLDQQEVVRILDRAVPTTDNDMVVIFIAVTGLYQGRSNVVKTYTNVAYPDDRFTAIQRTTAGGALAALQYVLANLDKFSKSTSIRNEQIPVRELLVSPFWQPYVS